MNLSSVPGLGLRAIVTALASLVIAGTSDAAIAQRGTAATTNAGQNATSIAINKPSGVAAGDVLLAVITKNVQTIGTTSAPSGWTQVDARNINAAPANNKIHGAVFYRVADGSEGGSFSFGLGGGTAPTASNGASGAIVAFSGVDGTGGVQADGSAGGPFSVDPGNINVAATGNAASSPGATTAGPGAGIVMLGMVGGASQTWSNWNTTSPGALTEIAEITRAGSSAGVAWALQGSAGATGNGTATTSLSTQPPGALLLALKQFIPPGPVINSFTVSPTAIAAGGSATLSWNVTGADTVTIDNGVGSVAAGSGTQSVSPAATTTYTLSATNGDGTNTTTATVTVAPAGSYRYFRFVPVALRDNGAANSIQISEFQMLSGGTRLTGATASNPGGNSPGGEGAAQANDNNLGSKWLDFTKFTPLILDFGTFQSANGYRIGTANDSDERDPVSWRVEGSINGSTWVVLDEQTNFAFPTDREIYVPDFAISSGPAISFSASPTTVVEGSSSTLTWTVVGADAGTISIDNGIGTVAASGSLSVSPAATTTYTISATGAGTTNTKTATVTVIPPPPPAITFTANPPAILAGGNSTLSWTVTGATTVSIDNGIGTVAASGTQSVSPAATTTYTLSATGPGGSNTGTATVTIAAGGLNGTSYDTISGPSQLNPIANVLGATPSASFLQVNSIDYQDNFVGTIPGLTSPDTFSVVWQGFFDVTMDGTGDYTFGTESDDGSVVYIDLNDDDDFADAGELIVSNNQDQPPTTGTGTVNLTANNYRIVIAFYEAGGGDVMRARFKKGNGLAWGGLDPVNGLTGHFLPSRPLGGPPSVTFTATPPAVLTGGSSTLNWTVTNADTVSINNGIGAVALSGSLSVSPAATTTYTLTATNPNGTTTRTATVTVVPPGSYRYYRFVPVALRDTGAADSVQISEFQMLDGGNRIAGATASNPGGNSPGGEGPDKGNDNDLSSKWLDFTKTTPLILDFGAPTATTGYRIGSANDAEERDPVSWRVEGSHDGTAWVVLDEKTGYVFPTARETYLPDFFFNRAPVFTGFAASTPFETQAAISNSEILLNASDPDGDTVAITAAGPATAQGGTAVLQATTILYTPAAGYTGADSFSITLSDGRGGLTTGTVTVTVDANGGIGPNAPTITLGAGTAQVLFHGIPGRNYEVQRSTNLVDWTVLSTVTAAPNGDIPYTDTNRPVGAAFYRMRVP